MEKRMAYFKNIAELPEEDLSGDGGIMLRVEREGQGELPPAHAKVKAHYTGRLQDGTIFDSSVERSETFDFELGQGQVIQCWDKGFARLKKGAFWQCVGLVAENLEAKTMAFFCHPYTCSFPFNAGAKAHLKCASNYAYGDSATGRIPAKATLYVRRQREESTVL